MRHAIAYLAAFVVMTVLDALWLGVIAADLYQQTLGHLLAAEVRWGAALAFYLCYLAGIVFFAIAPAASARRAALLGAAFGFFTYMTYDFTNLATLRDWPLEVVVIDIVWGMALSAVVAACGWRAAARWAPR